MLGASAASLSDDWSRNTLSRFVQGSVHSRVVRRLKEVQGEQSRFKLRYKYRRYRLYIGGDPAHGPSGVHSGKAKADIKGKWSVR